jgi:DNA-binding CsgD family transcriptional regulator
MSQQENRVADSHVLDFGEARPELDGREITRLPAARGHGMDQAGHVIARQLNGPLTALLLYIEELKRHSDRIARDAAERDHLQKVVQNALQQTVRVCALVKEIGGVQDSAAATVKSGYGPGWPRRTERGEECHHTDAVLLSDAGQKPLTRREREVLDLISQGYSNKQGALHMRISPRTFESHRAEAMRKLGARNTADLVRAVLLHPGD